MFQPKIIQGGMGVAVSGWKLARAVSKLGQLGVVSGTALAIVLVRRLQLGDLDGDVRRALSHFPFPNLVTRIIADYYIPNGKLKSDPFKLSPLVTLDSNLSVFSLIVVANFVEVFLAKEGHSGVVGINLLEKVQLPTLASLYGAMLAGVDYVLMGAGIPRFIPGVLDSLARGDAIKLRIDVEGALKNEEHYVYFDPKDICGDIIPVLKRPYFLGIIASAILAITLAKKASGVVDGFIIEGWSAGGHNAPPRGVLQLALDGQPIYGLRDVVDLDKIRELGLPFWLAGSFGRCGKLADAISVGAAGIQVGSAFAFCKESGISDQIKKQALDLSRAGGSVVFTDVLASPTGFPFKVVCMDGTISDSVAYCKRIRNCELGYLRHPYRKLDGSVGYRCPSEAVSTFVSKGGSLEQTVGRKCVCTGLSSTVGLGQVMSDSQVELPLVTAGDDFGSICEFVPIGRDSYSVADVLNVLLL